MARPQPVVLGPFGGGINTYSDPSSIDESELVDCLNMELDIDGSLVCRIPVKRATVQHQNAWNDRLKCIGQGVWPSSNHLFGSASNGLWELPDEDSGWNKIATSPNNVEFRAAVQCGKVVAFIPANPNQGGYWSPSTGWISDAAMPAGNAGVYFKGRLWIVPGPNPPVSEESRLRYSDPITQDITNGSKPVWDGPIVDGNHMNTNWIDVTRGNGQDLVDIKVYLDQLLMFKTDSTFVLAYDSTISQGLLQAVSTTIGATQRVCVDVWEDLVYVFHQGAVYEIKNYNFEQVNTKVPFVLDTTQPTLGNRGNSAFLNVIGDRLFVRFYNKVYVFGLLTRTWSRFQSTDERLNNVGYLRPFPTDALRAEPYRYIGGSVITNQKDIFELQDFRSSGNFESYDRVTRLDIKCSIITKTLDMNDPYNYKKLGWWGVDIIGTGDITGYARPIQVTFGRTWDSLSNQTWQSLETHPWSNPSDTPYYEKDDYVDTSNVDRKFVKFRKALRFRKINFGVELTSDGSTVDGPARIFTLIPWIGAKETVVKKVS